MSETPQSYLVWRFKPWQTILLFGVLLFGIIGLGTFFFDFFAGSATLGFGVQPEGEAKGTGMFFLYMIGYFNALVVILPILLIRRFGVGTAIYLPMVLVGFPIGYYYEWIVEPLWIAPWAGLGWSVAFLAVGFSADLTYRFLPTHFSERLRAILIGIVLASITYVLTLVALAVVYKGPLEIGPGSFLCLTYFGLPWLIANSAFGGYTAYAISQNV